ncbi:hypothetical protein KZC51_03880 [Microbacterium sp. SSW1-49]|uniref:Amino acid transporter n=1 Tax=Microbacterium croceum TaxID=2851645 RepID=A0ABT0FC20_9MICO|nr:hypothetical protein [Microbacterium croceum]MCK2035267.1 hypothetical protein [Microbacterium croceum]
MLINTVAVLLAVSAGLMFGARTTGPHRWMLTLAPLLVVAAAFIGAIALGPTADWAGPIFGIVCATTSVLASAAVRRDEPAFRGEPYWRQVLMDPSGRYPAGGTQQNETGTTGR